MSREADVDPALLDSARAGDRDAFAALVRHYDRGLRALAYRLLGDRERMDDALQEAYLRAFRGLPRFRRRGAFPRELRIERLAVDPEVSADAFRPRFPAGAEVMRADDGFSRVALEDVAGAVGYAPLAPVWVPDGYQLAEVAAAREAGPTGTEAGNPPSRMVVSLAYRRGLDRFLVTTRLAGEATWSDPLATGEGFVDRPQRIVLAGGALGGEPAALVIAPRGIPHVWAQSDELVVTVGGDLSRAELVNIAESLTPRP